ncbi:MAG TPA: hypothetical protein VK281_01725 [Xanthobacteraceae bacterium]|nr:hypothetical protein [Xanthobacteraceae bacterium]
MVRLAPVVRASKASSAALPYLAFFLLLYGDIDRRAMRESLTRATGTPDNGGVLD